MLEPLLPPKGHSGRCWAIDRLLAVVWPGRWWDTFQGSLRAYSALLHSYAYEAMKDAPFEWLEDDHEFYGELPHYPGVWAMAPTEAEARQALEHAMIEWLQFRLKRGMSVEPVALPQNWEEWVTT